MYINIYVIYWDKLNKLVNLWLRSSFCWKPHTLSFKVHLMLFWQTCYIPLADVMLCKVLTCNLLVFESSASSLKVHLTRQMMTLLMTLTMTILQIHMRVVCFIWHDTSLRHTTSAFNMIIILWLTTNKGLYMIIMA